MRTIVIGAGIAGLAAAYDLERLGLGKPLVLEQQSSIGGLCRTIERDGFTFDAVSHVLHFSDPKIASLVEHLLGQKLCRSLRRARIYHRGRFVPYPFQTNIGSLSVGEGAAALFSCIGARMRERLHASSQAKNFEAWIYSHFGKVIAEAFMIPYNRKLWGVSPREMSLDWMRFVPNTPISMMLASFFHVSHGEGYNSAFQYPEHGGIQALPEAFASQISDVRVNTAVKSIDLSARRVQLESGESLEFTRIVNTIPLTSLIGMLRQCPARITGQAATLRATSILSIALAFRRPLKLPDHWIYFADPAVPFFRLFLNSNVSAASAPQGCSVVSLEISNPDPGRDYVEECIAILKQVGVVAPEAALLFSNVEYLPYAYPVHTLDRKSTVDELKTFLAGHDIFSIGRFGSWSYNSIEDCVLEASNLAEEMAQSPAAHLRQIAE